MDPMSRAASVFAAVNPVTQDLTVGIDEDKETKFGQKLDRENDMNINGMRMG